MTPPGQARYSVLLRRLAPRASGATAIRPGADAIRILVVTTRYPVPPQDGGTIRTFHLLRDMARHHRVHVLAYGTPPPGEDPLVAAGVEVELVAPPAGGAVARLRAALGGLAGSQPMSIRRFQTARLDAAFQRCIQEVDFDLVHYDHLHVAPLARFARHLPSMLIEHNVEHRIWERLGEMEGHPLRRAFLRWQGRRMRHFEAQWCGDFTRCVVMSRADGDVLGALAPDACIRVLPNGVDTDYFAPPAEASREVAVACTGRMDWLPNVDMVQHFCRDILPQVRREAPGTTFYVVGIDPSPAVRRLHGDGVVVTGTVPDVRPWVARAPVFVVPLRIGSGTRLKILEALSMERAVVATSIGAEGLDVTDGTHLVIADSPGEFAARTVQLLGDAPRRRALGRAGRRHVEQRYGWAVIAAQQEAVHRELAKDES